MEMLLQPALVLLGILGCAADIAALALLLAWPERAALSCRQQLLRNTLLSCWITLNGFLMLRTVCAWLDDGQPFWN